MTMRKFRVLANKYLVLLSFVALFLTARFHHFFFVVVIHLCTITAKIDEEILFFYLISPTSKKRIRRRRKIKKEGQRTNMDEIIKLRFKKKERK